MNTRRAIPNLHSLPTRNIMNMSSKRLTRSASSAQPTATSSPPPSNPPARAPKRANPSPKSSKENDTEAPATPPPKRPRVANPPPQTPTPAPISLLSGLPTPSRRSTASATLHPLESRPADPHTTNAPLITPRGSRLTTYPSLTTTSPSNPGRPATSAIPSSTLPPPTTTTTTLLAEACAHLIRTEPRLAPVIAAHPCGIFAPAGLAAPISPFASLASGIIAQQVSGAAASSIKKKFIGLFTPPAPGSTSPSPAEPSTQTFSDEHGDTAAPGFPTPAQVVKCEVEFLRQAGLSGRKAEYIHGLAGKFVSGELRARMLLEAPYEEVLEELLAVRGLGRWSVEMFACFGLKRMDVFSVGDLGVQYVGALHEVSILLRCYGPGSVATVSLLGSIAITWLGSIVSLFCSFSALVGVSVYWGSLHTRRKMTC